VLDCTWDIKTLKREHTVQNHSATVGKNIQLFKRKIMLVFVYLFYTVELNENHLHYSAKNYSRHYFLQIYRNWPTFVKDMKKKTFGAGPDYPMCNIRPHNIRGPTRRQTWKLSLSKFVIEVKWSGWSILKQWRLKRSPIFTVKKCGPTMVQIG